MTGSRAVVITGCSSGIGRAVALRLVGRGYAVYATARRTTPLRELAAAGIGTALRLLTAHEARDPVYTAFRDDLAHCYRRVQRSPRRYGAGSPERVARVVERALSARSPRSRYIVGTAARASLGLRRTLPGAWFDALVRAQLPTPCPKR